MRSEMDECRINDPWLATCNGLATRDHTLHEATKDWCRLSHYPFHAISINVAV
jgi:hypothetical protein